eukprot:756694-Hanusia_phi.AAC.5
MLQLQWLDKTRPESRSIVCDRAVKWVERAAEGGSLQAEESVALWTLHGTHGVKKNPSAGCLLCLLTCETASRESVRCAACAGPTRFLPVHATGGLLPGRGESLLT